MKTLVGFVSSIIADPQPADGKDHVLFVGTDLSVKQDGQFYHVVRATKDSFMIERDHAIKEVRASQKSEIRITRGVKLSLISATIDNLKTDSVDRAAARAQFQAIREQIVLADEAQDTADRLHGRIVRASANGGVQAPQGAFASRVAAGQYAPAADTGASDLQVVTDAYVNALPSIEANIAGASSFFLEQSRRTGDAGVELSFDVSSAERIENAYLVVVANYADGDKVARQVSARELKLIDRQPTRIKLIHPAVLAGLAFKKFAIGLYANGQEVATNVSESRMRLTADQAYQFFLIDYLAKHPGVNAPPAAMLMTPRAEFRQQIGSAKANQPIYATIDKNGAVVATSSDEAGEKKLPASVELALQRVRFLPALQNGKPVDGRVKITLAQLVN